MQLVQWENIQKQQKINVLICQKLKEELPEFDFNFGAIFYRDPVDCPGEKNNAYPLTDNIKKLKRLLSS